MGLINQTQQDYYQGDDFGGYQFVSIEDIIDNFAATFVGEGKILQNVLRADISFHAHRALQELSFDTFKSCKSQEIEVPPHLTMPLPQDYVNYVKLTRTDAAGIEHIIYPALKTSNPFPIKQDSDGNYEFDSLGDLDEQSPSGQSDTWQSYQNQSTVNTYTDDTTDLEIDNRGRRYGLDPQFAQSNGTFILDDRTGFIHFSSSLAGETIILKYISDGLGTDEEMIVHKFCEEAVYKWIAYGILSTRSNMPEHVVQRFKKEKFAETRKAKIRLSNIKMEEFTQVLKGMSKQIK